jgi:hypothetical protein
MTDPIKYDPALHVIVPRVATRGFKSMTDEGAMVLKCHEDTPVMNNRTKIAIAVYNAMIAASPPITIDAPSAITKAEAVEMLGVLDEWLKYCAQGGISHRDQKLFNKREKLRRLLEAAAQQGE